MLFRFGQPLDLDLLAHRLPLPLWIDHECIVSARLNGGARDILGSSPSIGPISYITVASGSGSSQKCSFRFYLSIRRKSSNTYVLKCLRVDKSMRQYSCNAKGSGDSYGRCYEFDGGCCVTVSPVAPHQ